MRGCRSFTDEELQRLYGIATPMYRALISLGVRTGFRISELISIRWYQVINTDWTVRDTVEVFKRHTKGSTQSRRVPMHDETKRFVLEYLETIPVGDRNPHEKLFPGVYTTHFRKLKKLYTRASIREDMGTIATHTFRKSFADKMYKALDKDIFKLQMAMGHKSISSTARYLSANEEEIFDVMKKVK